MWGIVLAILGNAVKAGLGFIPPKVLFFAVLALLLIVGSGYAGYQWRDYRATQEQLEAVSRAIEQAKEQQAIDREILEEGFEVQREIEIEYRTIYLEATTVATPECTDLGNDWVRVFNDAVRGTQ